MITFILAFSHFLCFALSKNPAKHFPRIPLTSLFWFLVLLASGETSKTACPFVLPSSFPLYFLPVPPYFLPDTSHAVDRHHIWYFSLQQDFCSDLHFFLLSTYLLLLFQPGSFLSEKIVVPHSFPLLVSYPILLQMKCSPAQHQRAAPSYTPWLLTLLPPAGKQLPHRHGFPLWVQLPSPLDSKVLNTLKVRENTKINPCSPISSVNSELIYGLCILLMPIA